MTPSARHSQRGGFAIGFIIGLLVGLVLALGVALYVTKVPVPFINKVPQRTAEQDAAEIEKNKNWDPNSALYGKNPAPKASAATAGAASAATPTAKASAPGSARDPAAILAGRGAASAPRGSASQVASTKPGADPFSYFLQVGAYTRTEEAEQQRAKMAMLGFEARLTEREQAGQTVYRVRLGPYEKKETAEATKEKLTEAGVETALVRVQR